MNTWEETAQRSLDAEARKEIERGRLHSRTTVYLAAVAIVAGPIGMVVFGNAVATNDGKRVLAAVASLASMAVAIAGRVAIEYDKRARPLGAHPRVLDEREVAEQLAARALAYRIATTVIILLSLLALLGLQNGGDEQEARDTIARLALYGFFAFGAGVMPALPQLLHLLRSPLPAATDEPAG